MLADWGEEQNRNSSTLQKLHQDERLEISVNTDANPLQQLFELLKCII